WLPQLTARPGSGADRRRSRRRAWAGTGHRQGPGRRPRLDAHLPICAPNPDHMGDMNAPTPTPLPIRALIAPVTPLQQNCTIVWCAKTLKAAIIDPGGEVELLMGALQQHGLTLEKIWITHGHLDHAG